MRILLFILVFPFVFANPGNASSRADSLIDEQKLKPIVQVFGAAVYNMDSRSYGYGFGRAHMGFEYQFNQKWSSKIIIDRGRPTTLGELSFSDSTGNIFTISNSSKEGANYTMFLKFASLQWRISDKFSLESGALLQNHYISQERFWGFRYVAQTFQDMYWSIPSTDLGFMAKYRISRHFAIDAALTNGEGPRLAQDPLGKVKIAAGLDFKNQKLQARIYYHLRESISAEDSPEQLFSFFTGIYINPSLRLGGEFNSLSHMLGQADISSYGFSVFSAWEIMDNTEVFARFDRLIFEGLPKSGISGLISGKALIAGLSWAPAETVHFSLNYRDWLPDRSGKKYKGNIALSMEYKF